MNPAFGAQESKAFVPLFSNTASKVCAEFPETPHVSFTAASLQLVSKWKDLIGSSPYQESIFDITAWLSRATLDAIGVGEINFFAALFFRYSRWHGRSCF